MIYKSLANPLRIGACALTLAAAGVACATPFASTFDFTNVTILSLDTFADVSSSTTAQTTILFKQGSVGYEFTDGPSDPEEPLTPLFCDAQTLVVGRAEAGIAIACTTTWTIHNPTELPENATLTYGGGSFTDTDAQDPLRQFSSGEATFAVEDSVTGLTRFIADAYSDTTTAPLTSSDRFFDGTVTITIQPGQTATMSAIATANGFSFSSVPAPTAALPFLAGILMRVKRRIRQRPHLR